MKAKELAKELMKHPDHEVTISYHYTDKHKSGISVRKINEVSDVGYSEKTTNLESSDQWIDIQGGK